MMNSLVSNESGQSSCAPSLQQSLLTGKMSHTAIFCSLCDLCYSSSLSEPWKHQPLSPARQNITAISTAQKCLMTRLKILFSSWTTQTPKLQRISVHYLLGGNQGCINPADLSL